MKHTIIEKAALKAKSEETGIPFSNLLAGYVLEELMYLIEDSPFSLFLWLKNSSALGVEQYRKKNLLTLDFAYVTDPRAMKREGIVPGQELSLKMGYVMLAYILKVEKVPDISWKGRASAGPVPHSGNSFFRPPLRASRTLRAYPGADSRTHPAS